MKVEVVNSTELRMGNEAFRARRRIGNLPMARLLSCGGTIGAPNAENVRHHAVCSVPTFRRAPGSTTLSTVVQGVGRSPNFAGNDVSCASTGAIERRIEELVRAKLPK